MSKKPVLDNNLRNKITQLEYTGLAGKEKEIKEIYKETTGKEPPNFEIYSSKEMGIGENSGFDGAAVHFYDKKITLTKYIISLEERNLLKILEMSCMTH
ncbi:hypothetical protein PVA20_12125 [Priestia sp. CNPSo 3706]|nr:DUF6792 domain-containing protein [Priestia megaterium]MDD1512937.1 hypothetical protein [Priestia megaterium]